MAADCKVSDQSADDSENGSRRPRSDHDRVIPEARDPSADSREEIKDRETKVTEKPLDHSATLRQAIHVETKVNHSKVEEHRA